MVTTRSSMTTSLVTKSDPIVALYWLEKRFVTYWFIRDVLPTLLSPRMMTFSKLWRPGMVVEGDGPRGQWMRVVVSLEGGRDDLFMNVVK